MLLPSHSLDRFYGRTLIPNEVIIDVLAEFATGALRGLGLGYFDFAEELGAILGDRVDFASQLHPLIREQVRREAVKLYEQA